MHDEHVEGKLFETDCTTEKVCQSDTNAALTVSLVLGHHLIKPELAVNLYLCVEKTQQKV